MDNRKNLMKGYSVNECLSGTYFDVAIWNAFNFVARLYQKKVNKSRPMLRPEDLWDGILSSNI